eukprot:2605152-Prymnesium_polylepis.1
MRWCFLRPRESCHARNNVLMGSNSRDFEFAILTSVHLSSWVHLFDSWCLIELYEAARWKIPVITVRILNR